MEIECREGILLVKQRQVSEPDQQKDSNDECQYDYQKQGIFKARLHYRSILTAAIGFAKRVTPDGSGQGD